jgi:hypothetical protein
VTRFADLKIVASSHPIPSHPMAFLIKYVGPREVFLEDPIQDCAIVLARGTVSVGWVIGVVGTYSFPFLLLSHFEVFAVFPRFLLYIISDDS